MATFELDGNAVIWRCDHEVLRVEGHGRDGVRSRCSLDEVADGLPGALLEQEVHSSSATGPIDRAPDRSTTEVTLGQDEAVLVNGRLRASISRASGRVRYADEVTRRELLREQPAHFWWPGARWLRPIGGGRLHVEQHFAGFDYPLQADPRRLWELSVEGVRKAAEPYPELPFAIEYKPEEPRTHLFFSDAARTLLAIEDIGLANVGILIDFGHSLYGGESPAAAVELCVARGRLIDVDLNDNFRSWDDDMTVGSVHLVETLEFLLSLKRAGWDKPWKLDQFPFREDPVEAARASVRMLAALLALAERIDPDELAAARENQDAIAAQRLAYDILFGEIVKPE